MPDALRLATLKAEPPYKGLTWGAIAVLSALPVIYAVSKFNLMLLIILATLPLVSLVFINVAFGMYCLLGYATVLAFLIRMLPVAQAGPVGIALDLLLVLMGLRLALDGERRRGLSLFKTPLTLPVLAFAAYQCLDVFNPAAPSIMSGIYGLRDTLRVLGFFLVLAYMRKPQALGRLMGFFLGLMFLVGLYGIFQHHHGLLWQEMNWLQTEGNAQTHILDGYVRVFSTVGDASTFGFLMAIASLLAFSLALSAKGLKQGLLIAATLPMLYAMVISYSRGCVVALAAGIAVMILASRNWKLLISVACVAVLGLGLLIGSGSTRLVDRLGTATNPTGDASFMVRVGYITELLPHIATHPFGYGMNATEGAYGKSGTDAVAGVPTDNYYFKTALELGWVGLLFFLWLQLAALFYSYHVYRRCLDPRLKSIALGIFSMLCALFVGDFSNNLFIQKPVGEFFWIALGVIMLIGQLQGSPGGNNPQAALQQEAWRKIA